MIGAMPSHIQSAAQSILEADALLITAGAGMGVDSGLPDFRGREGFWNAYPVIAKLGLSFADMANPSWFENDPNLAWAFYGHRLNLYRATSPHLGFAKLLVMAMNRPAGYFVFTSNVDAQFQKAGFDAERIVECHGSIHHFQCANPRCTHLIWDANDQQVVVDEAAFRAQNPLPSCGKCKQVARPNIMMFNDMDWIDKRTSNQRLRLNQWLNELANDGARLVVIELGAGKAIPAVRHTSEMLTSRMQGTLIRINPRDPEVPANQIGIPLGALAGIQQVDEAMKNLASSGSH